MIERIEVFESAWRTNAPDAVFAGMTLAEFAEAVKAPADCAAELLDLRKQLSAKRVEARQAIATTAETLNLVVNSVRGTPGFGRDCALYDALGYVRMSDRKSGLTRKGSSNAASDTSAEGGDDPTTNA